jgi:NTP pyrophosphatase (non-canonical NTP hydrolase)
MNPDYSPLPETAGQVLNTCSEVVNEWAEKKGWNRPPNSAQEIAARRIAFLTLAIAALTTAIEDARKGRDVDSRVVALTESLNLPILPDELVRRVSQVGLMHTELAELVEGLLGGNKPDDHCPELTYEEAEMADLFIRAFHYCGEHGIDIGRALEIKHAYNTNRPDRHGDKLA